jgi:hypothetical protein
LSARSVFQQPVEEAKQGAPTAAHLVLLGRLCASAHGGSRINDAIHVTSAALSAETGPVWRVNRCAPSTSSEVRIGRDGCGLPGLQPVASEGCLAVAARPVLGVVLPVRADLNPSQARLTQNPLQNSGRERKRSEPAVVPDFRGWSGFQPYWFPPLHLLRTASAHLVCSIPYS